MCCSPAGRPQGCPLARGAGESTSLPAPFEPEALLPVRETRGREGGGRGEFLYNVLLVVLHSPSSSNVGDRWYTIPRHLFIQLLTEFCSFGLKSTDINWSRHGGGGASGGHKGGRGWQGGQTVIHGLYRADVP